MGQGKIFELLDFPKFAYPSIVGMDAVKTSYNLIERIGGKGFMSYGQIWPRMGAIIGGRASEAYVTGEFCAYSDDWKNESIRDAVRLLTQQFGGRGRWYPFPLKKKKILGFWFKPSIKGVWFVDGKAYAVLINARKGQPLTAEHRRFLARGVYELHCIDDPNDPIPMIVDLSEHDKGDGRKLRAHAIPATEAISFEEFDYAVSQFLKALALAGVALPTEAGDTVTDLFRKK